MPSRFSFHFQPMMNPYVGALAISVLFNPRAEFDGWNN
jgi:hypothetical protein